MFKKVSIYFWVSILVSLLVTSFAFAKRAHYTEEKIDNGGSLAGQVHFKGPIPPSTKIQLKDGKNVDFCLKHADPNDQGELLLQPVEVKGGKLKDAVIFFRDVKKGKSWTNKPFNIDFKDCQAFPKVTVVRRPPKLITKGLLTITNHDAGVLHNPKGFSIGVGTRKIFFKKLLLSKGSKVDVTKILKHFRKKRDSHFYVECEQHTWMSTSSRIVWNPYFAISKANGSYEIDQIPPGQYKVTVWHPYIGEKTFETTITKGKKTKLDINLP